jgi:hypothetical protein
LCDGRNVDHEDVPVAPSQGADDACIDAIQDVLDRLGATPEVSKALLQAFHTQLDDKAKLRSALDAAYDENIHLHAELRKCGDELVSIL